MDPILSPIPLCAILITLYDSIQEFFQSHNGYMDLKRIMAANIRKHRKYLSMSRYDLSAAADISLSYVNDLENGKKFPYEKTFVKLAIALQIEPYQLLIREESTGPVDLETIDSIRYDLESSFTEFLNEKFDDYKKER
jgi:transcriptional regulator with XRE-family HTH domain